MERYSDASILNVIEQYLVLTWMPPTALGRKAVDDPNLVDDMRAGRRLREATAHLVIDYIYSHLELLIATNELVADADSLREQAQRAGVDVVNRTVLLPLTPNQAVSLTGTEALA